MTVHSWAALHGKRVVSPNVVRILSERRRRIANVQTALA